MHVNDGVVRFPLGARERNLRMLMSGLPFFLLTVVGVFLLEYWVLRLLAAYIAVSQVWFVFAYFIRGENHVEITTTELRVRSLTRTRIKFSQIDKTELLESNDSSRSLRKFHLEPTVAVELKRPIWTLFPFFFPIIMRLKTVQLAIPEEYRLQFVATVNSRCAEGGA